MIVPVSGKVIGAEEIANMHAAVDEGWLTEGHWTDEFERAFADYIGVRFASFCNSGSSALVLACEALFQPELGDRQMQRGDEFITTALNFPTTISHMIRLGAVPVFCDVTIPEYNIATEQLEQAYSPKVKAVVLSHTLGRPFDVGTVKDFCDKYRLWLIEDACDSLGAEYNGKKCGSFGDISTFSFYPAHQITTGEGGMVCTNNTILHKVIESLRDWGRACWCKPGQDDTCGRRFEGDYDHKYTYARAGYNLKSTDIQAACGLAQLKHVDEWVASRQYNYWMLYDRLGYPDSFDCSFSPFGFPIICDDRKPFMQYLNDNGIGTRLFFGGNMLRQPMMKDVFCRSMDLTNTNRVHEQGLWIGCWHGLNDDHIEYMIRTIKAYDGLHT